MTLMFLPGVILQTRCSSSLGVDGLKKAIKDKIREDILSVLQKQWCPVMSLATPIFQSFSLFMAGLLKLPAREHCIKPVNYFE